MNIPKGWSKNTLKGLASDHTGSFTNGPFGSNLLTSELTGSGVPVIYIQDIHEGRYEKVSKGYVTTEKAESLKSCKTVKGDLILAKVGVPPCSAAIYNKEENAIITQDVIRLNTTNKCTSLYLSHWFNSHIGQNEVHKIKIVGSRDRVSLTDLKKVYIILPPLPEQKRIAELISTWDKAIEKTEQLIQAKEIQLHQFSKNLILGHKRLKCTNNQFSESHFYKYPSDWALVKIGEIAREISLRNENSKATVLSCSKYHGLINSLDYFGKQVFSNNISNYKVIKKGQFAYPSNHIEEGSIGFLNHCDIGIVSPIYVVFEVKNDLVHAPYLYELFKSNIYKHIFQTTTSSSVNRRGSLRWNSFSRIKVILPPIPEQIQISEALSRFKNEIDALHQLLQEFKKQKQGLMQKLLTGKWRVNTKD